MKHLEVCVKNVYGVERIYPVNAAALIISDLLRKKTFDSRDLEILKRLGYEIKQVEATKLEDL